MRMRSVLASLVVPSLLGAQREPLRQPASVPVELAAALASAGGLGSGTEPQILVGELPEWVATRIHVPDGTVVLGSAFMGTTVVGILQTLAGTEFPLREFEAEVAKKGWKRQELSTGQSGGFRSAPTTATPTIFPATFCSGPQMLRLSPGSSRQGKQSWVLRVSTPTGFGSCNPPPMSRRGEPELPTLYHPGGVVNDNNRMTRNCNPDDPATNRGPGNFTSARVRSTILSEELLVHYGRQLADSGWKEASSIARSVSGAWTRTDSAGKTMTLQLNIFTASGDPTCREMNLMIFSIERE